MYLGLDLGTTNVKATLTDDSMRIVAEGSAPVERFTAADGVVEQDLDQIEQAAIRAITQAVATIDPTSVLAIGISSQGGALQLLDADGGPMGRLISWMDQRGREYNDKLIESQGLDWMVDHTGCNLSEMTLGQLLRLKEQEPELFERTAGIGWVGDLIVERLCGRRAHDATSLSIAMLYNPKLRKADPDLLELLGIKEKRLPDLIPATESAGGLTAKMAKATGLPKGTPVSPAVHDQYAASLGAGSTSPGDVCLGSGTAWVLLANCEKLTRPAASTTFVCSHLVPGLFGQMLSMGNGGSAFDWALGLTGCRDLDGAAIDDLLECVPAGCEGLRFRPTLLPCRTCFDSDSDSDSDENGVGKVDGVGGVLSGVRPNHGPAHLLRAVVEGLANELALHVKILDEAGLKVERLYMCGTAAASRVTPRVIADVLNRPVVCIRQPSISSLGAAVLARAVVDGQPIVAFQGPEERETIEPSH